MLDSQFSISSSSCFDPIFWNNSPYHFDSYVKDQGRGFSKQFFVDSLGNNSLSKNSKKAAGSSMLLFFILLCSSFSHFHVMLHPRLTAAYIRSLAPKSFVRSNSITSYHLVFCKILCGTLCGYSAFCWIIRSLVYDKDQLSYAGLSNNITLLVTSLVLWYTYIQLLCQ